MKEVMHVILPLPAQPDPVSAAITADPVPSTPPDGAAFAAVFAQAWQPVLTHAGTAVPVDPGELPEVPEAPGVDAPAGQTVADLSATVGTTAPAWPLLPAIALPGAPVESTAAPRCRPSLLPQETQTPVAVILSPSELPLLRRSPTTSVDPHVPFSGTSGAESVLPSSPPGPSLTGMAFPAICGTLSPLSPDTGSRTADLLQTAGAPLTDTHPASGPVLPQPDAPLAVQELRVAESASPVPSIPEYGFLPLQPRQSDPTSHATPAPLDGPSYIVPAPGSVLRNLRGTFNIAHTAGTREATPPAPESVLKEARFPIAADNVEQSLPEWQSDETVKSTPAAQVAGSVRAPEPAETGQVTPGEIAELLHTPEPDRPAGADRSGRVPAGDAVEPGELPATGLALPSSGPQKVDSHSGLLHVTRPVSPTVARQEVIAQVTRHLESVHLAGLRGGITVQLQPESLGTLQINVTHLGEEIIARITAETASAQQAIESGKEYLRAALEQRGLRLAALDVSVGQQGLPGDSSHFAGQFAAHRERFPATTLSSVQFSNGPAGEPSAVAGVPSLEAPHMPTRLDFRV